MIHNWGQFCPLRKCLGPFSIVILGEMMLLVSSGWRVQILLIPYNAQNHPTQQKATFPPAVHTAVVDTPCSLYHMLPSLLLSILFSSPISIILQMALLDCESDKTFRFVCFVLGCWGNTASAVPLSYVFNPSILDRDTKVQVSIRLYWP